MRTSGGILVLSVAIGSAAWSHAELVSGSEPRSQSPTPSTGQPHFALPYTAEYKQTNVQTKADGASFSNEQIEISARDSHDRRSHIWTQIESGITGYQVEDPVAGDRIVWNTLNRQAKLLKYPEPVVGRKSCWKLAPEEMKVEPSEAQLGITGSECPPAGGSQPPYCKGKTSSATATNEELPVITVGYPTCAQMKSRGGSVSYSGAGEPRVEDLGTQRIQGFEAQGCKATKDVPRGLDVDELWWVELRMGNMRAWLPVREVYGSPVFEDQTRKRIRELTLLRPGEPDAKIFRPSSDYEVRTVEMHEVPCEPSTEPATGSAPKN
jgi:hypothetical protein